MNVTALSKDPHLLPPPIPLRIHRDLKRERIRLIRRNRRDIIPILIHDLQNPQRRLLQAQLHPSSIPLGFRLAPRARQTHVENPHFPDGLFVRLGDEPAALFAFLLQELHDDRAVGGFGGGGVVLGGGSVEGAEEGGGARVDGAFDVVFGHVGEGGVEDVVGGGEHGREQAVEEDRVQDACPWGINVCVAAWGLGFLLPFTTSLTLVRSAVMSSVYSGGRRDSMVSGERVE